MKIIVGICFLSIASLHAQDIYIIVHGTWAHKYHWHKPGGDFFEQLNTAVSTCGGHVSFHIWSGKNNHKARVKAAYDLIDLMHTFASNDRFIVIGHSHGGNVINIASQILGNDPDNRYAIYKFFSLATPVCPLTYMPNMRIIEHVYHFMSYADMVQPVFGFFRREYPSHERIANIRILIEDKEPDHCQIHDPLLAQWIFMIHHDLRAFRQGNFELFAFNQPGVINFHKDRFPEYWVDVSRKRLIEQEKNMHRLFHMTLEHHRRVAQTA